MPETPLNQDLSYLDPRIDPEAEASRGIAKEAILQAACRFAKEHSRMGAFEVNHSEDIYPQGDHLMEAMRRLHEVLDWALQDLPPDPDPNAIQNPTLWDLLDEDS